MCVCTARMGLARVIIRRVGPGVRRGDTRMASGEQIDKLASVSRVLFEQRILDLQKEKLELQKRVMDLEYGDVVLNLLLAGVNDTGLTEVCQCPGCYCSKRFSEMEPEEVVKRLSKVSSDYEWEKYPECLLRKCLIWQCERLGLTVQIYNACDEEEGGGSDGDEDEEEDEDDNLGHDSPEAHWSAYDSMAVHRCDIPRKDCHVIVVDKGCGTWGVVYGRKFVDTGLFGNPDADKLKALFELVRNGEEFFKVDGKDYFTMADDAPSSETAV